MTQNVLDLRSQPEPPLKRLRMPSEAFVPPWQYDSLPEGLKTSQGPSWGVETPKMSPSPKLKSMVYFARALRPCLCEPSKTCFFLFSKSKSSKKKKKTNQALTQIGERVIVS